GPAQLQELRRDGLSQDHLVRRLRGPALLRTVQQLRRRPLGELPMRTAAAALVTIAAIALGAGAALAKPPKPADMPTVEDIYQQAKTAIDLKLKAEADQSHDPTRDLIDAYRDKKTKLDEYQP